MELLITATDESPSREQLSGLWTWLADRKDPYRVDGVHRPPEPDTLGGVLEALSVAAASGGAVTVLISGVLEWIRNGRGKDLRGVPLTITLEGADGVKVAIETEVAQAWTSAELAERIEGFAALLRNGTPVRPDDGGDTVDGAAEGSGGGDSREAP